MIKLNHIIFSTFLLLLLASSVSADLSWTTANSFKIYSTATTLSWGTGTLVCQGTLTDSNAQTITCDSGTISDSTNYRVEIILVELDSTSSINSGDIINHTTTFAADGWAGSGGTIDKCGYNDFDGDDGGSTCTATKSNGDAVLTIGSTLGVASSAGTGKQGFMYNLTTGTAATSSTSYIDPILPGGMTPEASSKITISIAAVAAVPEFGDYAIILILVTVFGGFFSMKHKKV